MSFLKNKSNFNFSSAKLLIDGNYYAPSVHCSYYAVLQLLKHGYVKHKSISYESLNEKINNDKRNSHTFLIDEFCLNLQSISKLGLSIYDIRNLKRDIKDLKQFRVDSDYENVEIDYSKSNKAYNLSDSILKRIKKTL